MDWTWRSKSVGRLNSLWQLFQRQNACFWVPGWSFARALIGGRWVAVQCARMDGDGWVVLQPDQKQTNKTGGTAKIGEALLKTVATGFEWLG